MCRMSGKAFFKIIPGYNNFILLSKSVISNVLKNKMGFYLNAYVSLYVPL